eukprot:TRINITY_DN7513_c0_g1_i2.p1 TRINITY_DN7513_c0_g1~~TRINITY_DN7513_c0_g1_i2.p1  ORF type:complete len:415 (-),score=84.93 TRINITY_DN7513_c0_g1_i2:811-1926(-)
MSNTIHELSLSSKNVKDPKKPASIALHYDKTPKRPLLPQTRALPPASSRQAPPQHPPTKPKVVSFTPKASPDPPKVNPQTYLSVLCASNKAGGTILKKAQCRTPVPPTPAVVPQTPSPQNDYEDLPAYSQQDFATPMNAATPSTAPTTNRKYPNSLKTPSHPETPPARGTTQNQRTTQHQPLHLWRDGSGFLCSDKGGSSESQCTSTCPPCSLVGLGSKYYVLGKVNIFEIHFSSDVKTELRVDLNGCGISFEGLVTEQAGIYMVEYFPTRGSGSYHVVVTAGNAPLLNFTVLPLNSPRHRDLNEEKENLDRGRGIDREGGGTEGGKDTEEDDPIEFTPVAQKTAQSVNRHSSKCTGFFEVSDDEIEECSN